ncbi:hypothetical protein IFM89_008628 [Coptis chinensis]|uniref:Receptor-like serine/threonine-protein kinase n=1 Tax=Coptis chinensis TaxID=261450 RepID=A0A835GYF4_9MAGN|nr:hypothetical protein IFM89_008628 [Coptis chinensis]
MSCSSTTQISVFVSFLFLFSCTIYLTSHAADTLSRGEIIRDGQTILSQSENFALGFFSPGNSTNRYVGIWYNRISIQTVVWVANRENPIRNSSGSITIGTDGNLVVSDGTGNFVWSTSISVASNNSSAVLVDSGNLLLFNDDVRNPDKALWQSFEAPSDTYLPGMRVGLNPRNNETHRFTSWKSENDPSTGNFSLGVDPEGVAQIVIFENLRRRWRSGLWNRQIFIGIPNMMSQSLYGFQVSDEGGRMYITYSVHSSSEILRFRIRWDGTEQQLRWDEGRNEWVEFWAQPTRVCEFYNRCGAFGSCSESTSSICTCIRGFESRSRSEWDSGNWSGGCVRRTELECNRNVSSNGGGRPDRFLELDRVKLPDFSVSRSVDNRNHCRDNCLSNCSCNAYAYESGIGCLTWSGNLVDIQNFPQGGSTIFIRLAESELRESKKRVILIIVLVVVLGTLSLCISAYIFWRCRAKLPDLCRDKIEEPVIVDETKSGEFWKEFSTQHDTEGHQGNGPELPMHSLQDIEIATHNFSPANRLGEGGFGPVYKGTLPCGKEVAVKRLSRKSGQGLEEFKNEIILIAKLQHRNLVRLLGYCIEGEEKILVYEYLPNKSLDAFIFANPQERLDWGRRFNIIEGIARGLLYLHRDSRLRIIHRDLKASNILLDEEMNPKISDFGMAKIFGGNDNQGNTNRVVGTYGYMAPEYAMEGLFSVKSDVYSFGVLLLEIVSGKKNQYRHPEYSMNLIGYAWNLWREKRPLEFLDPSIRDSCSPSTVLRCIHVGLLCVQDSAMDRPIMSTVVLMLESDSAIVPMPRQPTFTMGRNLTEMELSLDSSEVIISRNNMTNTMVVGR